MEIMGNNFMPGDPRLVEQLVYELKSQGIFDQFRKECIADVDTKPAYQNLRQRVEGTVSSFLKQQTWKPDMIKNQLREQLRKKIHESGYLEAGVERIVEQVVNPKINNVILPQVEDVAYRFLGIEKPVKNNVKKELDINISDLLPKDLEAVSPDSVHSFNNDRVIDDEDNMTRDSNLKAEDEESPPFEPLVEPNIKSEVFSLEDNSVDSHFSGFSGLHSHESSHYSDVKLNQADHSNMDYQVSQNDSEGRISDIILNEVTKMDICEDSLSHHEKSEASESKLDTTDNENEEVTNDNDVPNDANNKDLKRVDDEIKTDNKSSKSVSKEKKDKYTRSSSKSKSSKDTDSSKDKYRKESRSSSSSIKEKDQKDRSREKYKEKSSKSDKSTKEKSEKERDKSEKHDKEIFDKKKSEHHKDKSDKGNKDKNRNSEKSSKEIEKSSRSKEKVEKDEDNKIDSEKNEKDQENTSSEEKSKDKDKNKISKSRSTKETHSSDKSKRESDGKSKSSSSKHKSSSTSKRESSGTSSTNKSRSSSSSSKDKLKTVEHDKSSNKSKSSEDKNTTNGKSSSRKEDEKKRDPKKQSEDDHYGSKLKKNSRRSSDRDSNDGNSDRNNSTNSFSETCSSQVEKNDNESCSSGPVDSGDSDEIEPTSDTFEEIQIPITATNESVSELNISLSENTGEDLGDSETLNQSETTTESVDEGSFVAIGLQPLKLTKPKFASNFQEARKLMKIRKQLAKLEKQNRLGISSDLETDEPNLADIGSTNQQVDPPDTLSKVNVTNSIKLNKPKFASNFQEARKLMKIRKQLAKLERENQRNVSAAADAPSTSSESENISETVSDFVAESPQPLKLNKPKFASNFREATKLMRIRKQLAKLAKENKLGLADISGLSENCVYNLDSDSNGESLVTIKDSPIKESLKGTELSQENWEALEARLAQEMSNINYNCYDEDDEAGGVSPIKNRELQKNNTNKIEITSDDEDSQNDFVEFKGFNLEDDKTNSVDELKKDEVTAEKRNNLKHNMITEIDTESDGECRYLEQQSANIKKNLQYLRKFIGMLEKGIEHGKNELQNNIHQIRGQKRKFEECVDLKNNNKAYFEQTTVKKRGRRPGSNSDRTKAVKMSNSSDILQSSFPLPLSPAESDQSIDKKEEEIVVPAKRKRMDIRASQRYSSEDLYKPRFVICRRSRGAKNNT